MQSPLPPLGVRRAHVRRQPATLPLWFVFGVVGVALLAGLVVGTLVFWSIRNSLGVANAGGPDDFQLPPPPCFINCQPGEEPLGTPEEGFGNWRWQGSDRVTVLVMGIDQRRGEQGPFRTDTMMLMSVDPVNQTAVLLSIPRDLWVTLPDFGYGKTNDRINTANVYGEVYEYPGGGPALAARTVQLNLGITVDHYVIVNFAAFETFVDQIGGIDVDVPEDIYDPSYPTENYGTQVFELAAGAQHLDGPTALKYARTRHTIGSDFDRAKRQQQVVLAVRDKVSDLNMLPQLLTRAPEIYANFSESVQTDLSLKDLIGLALLGQDIPREHIRSAVIDETYSTNWQTPEGAQVLIPDREKISALMLSLYAPPAASEPTATPDPSTQMAVEGARIVVENGTLTAGLASTTADYLGTLGFNVVDATNADRFDYQATLIIDYTGKPYTTRYLAELFNVDPGNVLSGSNPESPVDVKVILGADAAGQ